MLRQLILRSLRPIPTKSTNMETMLDMGGAWR